MLAPHRTKANCDELLTQAIHKTKDAIKELVAEIAPKPDVLSVVRKLVSRQAKFVPQTPTEPRSDGAGPDSVGENCQAPPPAPAPKAPEKLAVVEPLAPARYKVQFTASAEFRDKIDRLSALMLGVDLASVMEAAVSEKLERLEAKRFGKTKTPRKGLEEANTSPGVRGISAPVRRFVWERDGGQCTYETKDGRRCPAREGVEFHHDEPYGVGGDRSAEKRFGSLAKRITVTWLSWTSAKTRWTATVAQRTACVNRNRHFNSRLDRERVVPRSLPQAAQAAQVAQAAQAGRGYCSRGTSTHIQPRRSATSKPVASSSGWDSAMSSCSSG